MNCINVRWCKVVWSEVWRWSVISQVCRVKQSLKYNMCLKKWGVCKCIWWPKFRVCNALVSMYVSQTLVFVKCYNSKSLVLNKSTLFNTFKENPKWRDFIGKQLMKTLADGWKDHLMVMKCLVHSRTTTSTLMRFWGWIVLRWLFKNFWGIEEEDLMLIIFFEF